MRALRTMMLSIVAAAIAAPALAANPLEVLLEDFENGDTAGAVAADNLNSSSGGATNSTITNAVDAGSGRLRITDADGLYNGAGMTFNNVFTQPGYYLVTADVKVDNASAAIGSFGIAVREGGFSTAEISDVNAGYVMNLAGTGDAAKGYQTIGAAIQIAPGTFPKHLTVYFGTDPSGNTFNAPASDGNYNGNHRLNTQTWAAASSNAVYIDNIKMIGPGNFGEERHMWISVGDAYTNLTNLENNLVQAKNNNFNCIDILARYRADAYYVPNRTDATYPNPEPMGSRVGGITVTPGNDPLQYAVDRGHELGLKVYISFSCFLASPNNTYPSFLPAGSIMWYYNAGAPRAMTSTDPSAEGIWADVGRADVRNYHKNVLMDIVSNYDVDGVIFDRIRYPTNTYSYNPQALSEMGITGTPAPTDATFRGKRQDAVAQFLADCYAAVTNKKPWVVVGTVPIAYGDGLGDTYNAVFQSWPKWNSRLSVNRTVSFGVGDLIQPQFYRLWDSISPYQAPAANARLMDKAQFGDVAAFAGDFGLMPGALTAVAPLFYHPNSGDTNQSNANSQNIIDARARAMNGWGLYPATQTISDISGIRATTANSAGVDVLAQPSATNDYFMKAGYDNIAPNTVTNFTATPQGDGTVVFTWTAPAPAALDGDGAARYVIYRSTTAPVKEYFSNEVTHAEIPGTANTYTAPASQAGSYYFRIVAIDDYNNRSSAVQIGPYAVSGAPADIIVDNPAATFVGAWTSGTSAADKFGADYRYSSPGTGSNTATFAASVASDGLYDVYEWHSVGTNRTTHGRHTVNYDGGSRTVPVNQQINGGRWNLLGQFAFRGGNAYSTLLDNNFTVGTVIIADAIRLAYVAPLPAQNPPFAPSGLTANAISQSQVNLAWTDNSNNEVNFIVARSTTAGGPYVDIATIGANSTSYSDSTAAPNTTYYYVVRATNGAGASVNSNEASATTPAPPPPPAAPSGLSATAVSQSQINLSWTDNSNNEDNFIVARSTTAGGPYADIATLAAGSTSYSNTGLSASTTYYYVVRAVNAVGSSGNSNQASATTQAVPQPPAAPSNLTASAVSSSQINLAWTDNSADEANFVVARSSTSGGPYTDIATLSTNTTSYSNTGLAAGTTYHYVVRAVNVNGASANSNQASATTQAAPQPPAAPSGLAASPISSSQINLAWTDNSNNETNFVVERKSGKAAYAVIATLGANVTAYSNTGLARNTNYTYRVKATNENGSSAYSNEATAKTLR